jgi:hypothetical protein
LIGGPPSQHIRVKELRVTAESGLASRIERGSDCLLPSDQEERVSGWRCKGLLYLPSTQMKATLSPLPPGSAVPTLASVPVTLCQIWGNKKSVDAQNVQHPRSPHLRNGLKVSAAR